MGKPLKEGKKKYKGKVVFLGVNYPTLDSLKAVFKALIVKTKNDAIIEEPGRSQLLELLKHHDKAEEKLKDLADLLLDFIQNSSKPDASSSLRKMALKKTSLSTSASTDLRVVTMLVKSKESFVSIIN